MSTLNARKMKKKPRVTEALGCNYMERRTGLEPATISLEEIRYHSYFIDI
jgi:hypothetical protein